MTIDDQQCIPILCSRSAPKLRRNRRVAPYQRFWNRAIYRTYSLWAILGSNQWPLRCEPGRCTPSDLQLRVDPRKRERGTKQSTAVRRSSAKYNTRRCSPSAPPPPPELPCPQTRRRGPPSSLWTVTIHRKPSTGVTVTRSEAPLLHRISTVEVSRPRADSPRTKCPAKWGGRDVRADEELLDLREQAIWSARPGKGTALGRTQARNWHNAAVTDDRVPDRFRPVLEDIVRRLAVGDYDGVARDHSPYAGARKGSTLACGHATTRTRLCPFRQKHGMSPAPDESIIRRACGGWTLTCGVRRVGRI
jgi:hypothetical protein